LFMVAMNPFIICLLKVNTLPLIAFSVLGLVLGGTNVAIRFAVAYAICVAVIIRVCFIIDKIGFYYEKFDSKC